MITLSGEKAQFCDGMSRRNLLHAGFLGGVGLSLSSILKLQAETASKNKKAVIFVELAGGPTQFETYDPKPSAPIEIRGAYEPISTSVAGTYFSEWMPQQAKIADKLSIIRSVWHPSNSHDPSSHLTQTGYYKSGPKGGPNQFPAFGSVISRTIGPNHPALPSYVAVPSVMRNGRAAYLGQSHNPFESTGDPNKAGFEVPNLQLAKNISVDRLSSRRDLLTIWINNDAYKTCRVRPTHWTNFHNRHLISSMDREHETPLILKLSRMLSASSTVVIPSDKVCYLHDDWLKPE